MESFSKIKYYQYIQGSKWRAFRLVALDFYRHRCVRCKSTDCLQVHHKSYKNLFNESLEDVEVLCKNCHKRHHKIKVKEKTKKSKYMRDPHYYIDTPVFYPTKNGKG